jgi:hypothetical protein
VGDGTARQQIRSLTPHGAPAAKNQAINPVAPKGRLRHVGFTPKMDIAELTTACPFFTNRRHDRRRTGKPEFRFRTIHL